MNQYEINRQKLIDEMGYQGFAEWVASFRTEEDADYEIAIEHIRAAKMGERGTKPLQKFTLVEYGDWVLVFDPNQHVAFGVEDDAADLVRPVVDAANAGKISEADAPRAFSKAYVDWFDKQNDEDRGDLIDDGRSGGYGESYSERNT